MDKRLITVSKYLAKYLRHAPHELGLTLQPGGWVPVDDLLAAARKHGFPISYDDLVECVETNDKQRYAFDVSGEMIRANQGHSVEVDLQLEEREPPETLYHGTVERFLAVDLGRGAGPGQAAPRPSLKGRGDGTQGRGKERQAGHTPGRCRADEPGWAQVPVVGERGLADGCGSTGLSRPGYRVVEAALHRMSGSGSPGQG